MFLKGKKRLLKSLLFGVLLLWLLGTIYLVVGIRKMKRKIDTDETSKYIQNLERHVDFGGVSPTLARVNDAELLKKNDRFYESAVNGDVLVVWQGKAVLYRPSRDVIVDVGVVLPKETNVSQDAEEEGFSMAVLNGTSEKGLASKVKVELEENELVKRWIDEIEIGDAKQRNNARSLLVDLSGGRASSLIEALSEEIEFEIGELPSGESEDFDLVLILGGEGRE